MTERTGFYTSQQHHDHYALLLLARRHQHVHSVHGRANARGRYERVLQLTNNSNANQIRLAHFHEVGEGEDGDVAGAADRNELLI